MGIIRRGKFLVVVFILFFGVFTIFLKEVAADETVSVNLDEFNVDRFYNKIGNYSNPNDPRYYNLTTVVFRFANGEVAFCLEMDSSAPNFENEMEIVTLNSSTIISDVADRNKVAAILQYVNRSDVLSSVRNQIGNQNINLYDIYNAAQLAVWYYTDDYRMGSSTTSRTISYTVSDFLNLVNGSTFTRNGSLHVARIYDFFVDLPPVTVNDNIPEMKIDNLQNGWDNEEEFYEISYKINDVYHNGTRILPSRTYKVNGVVTDLSPYEIYDELTGEVTLKLESSFASKSIAIEVSGQIVYTGYYVIKHPTKQDISGYAKDKAIKISDNKNFIIPNKKPKTKFSIKKTKEDGITPLTGATFVLYRADDLENVYREIEVNVQGIAEFTNLLPGVYYYQEVIAPENYILDRKLTEITLPLVNSTKIEIFKNKQQAKFEIYKTNSKDEPLENVSFKIYNEERTFERIIQTNSSGIASIEFLPPGQYFYEEVNAPEGYFKIEGAIQFIMTDKPLQIPVINNPIVGSFTLTKVGEREDLLLGGAEFTVTYPDGTETKYTTAEEGPNKGKIVLENLPYGKYTVTETKPPAGYTKGTTSSYTFTVDEEEVAHTWTAVNFPITEDPTGSVHFVKMETGNPANLLTGAVFEIYRLTEEDNAELVSVTTTDSGSAVVSDLAYGDYYYVEKVAPPGYLIKDTEPKTFTISGDQAALTFEVFNDKEAPPVEPPACEVFVVKNLQAGEVLKVNGEVMTVPASGQLTLPISEFSNGVYVAEIFTENNERFMTVKITEDCVISFEYEKKCEVVIEDINWVTPESTVSYAVTFEDSVSVAEGDTVFVNGQEATIQLDENGQYTVDVLQEGPIERYKPQPFARVASLFASLETVQVDVGEVTNENGQLRFSFNESIEDGDQVFVEDMLYMVAENAQQELYLDGLEVEDEATVPMYQYEIVPEIAEPLIVSELESAPTSGDSGTVEPMPEPEQPVPPSDVPTETQPQPDIEQEKEVIGYVTQTVTVGEAITSGDTVTIENVGSFVVNGQLSLDEQALNEAALSKGTFELTVDGMVVGTVRLVEECTVEPPIVDPPDPPDRPDPPKPPVVDPPDPPSPPRPNPPTPRPPDDDDDDDGGGGGSTPPVITPPTPVDPPEEEPIEEEPPPTDTEEEFEEETPPANIPPPIEEELPPTDTEEEFEVVTPPANTPTIAEETPTGPPSRTTVVTTTRTVTVAPPVSNVYSSSPRLPQTDGATNNLQLLGYMLLATMFGIALIRRRRQQKR